MDKQKGELKAIWLKRAKLGPMDPKTTAACRAGAGLVGNANQGGRRQVTIISEETWQKLMSELSADVNPSARRANLMLKGIDLRDTRDRVLRIGECRIRVLGETRPCERMDQAFPGLKNAMSVDWGGGAFGEVLNDGVIKVGDAADWE